MSGLRLILKQRVILTLFFCLLFLPCLTKQAYSSDLTAIQGKVTEQVTKKPISGALVKVYLKEGNILASATTDTAGNYRITDKRFKGTYFIQASALSYQTVTLKQNFRLHHTLTLNFSLKPLATNSPPKITSLVPQEHSTFVTGDTLKISLTATDADQDVLQYRYLMDDKVLQDWTGLTSFSLKTTTADSGRHRIRVEVRDNKGGLVSKSIDIFIFIAFPKPAS